MSIWTCRVSSRVTDWREVATSGARRWAGGSTGLCALVAAVVVVSLSAFGAGRGVAQSSSFAVVADPPLTPAFDPRVPDYVVSCTKPVRMSFYAPPGVAVSIDGGRPRRGAFRASVSLSAGQGFRFVVSAADHDRAYGVRCLPGDFPGSSAKRFGRPQAAWYVVAPCCLWDYAAIYDSNGVPVWWLHTRQPVLDASLLPDGDVAVALAEGQGLSLARFNEYRLDGQFERTFSIPNGIPTDRHELQVLPNGDYIVVAHVPRGGVDLRPYGGPADATVLDALIAEVSPQHKLVWSWDSKDHVNLAETGRWYRQAVLAHPSRLSGGRLAYDIVHINAVAPYGRGFLVSLRNTDAVYAIDKPSGRVLWKLGGTPTPQSLGIIGDDVPDFGGQHDVRALSDGTVTLLDNGTGRGRAPRALRFRIDERAHTATLLEQLVDHQTPAYSPCCGSARKLPGGDWVVSWGGQRVVSELTPGDKPVFALTFTTEVSYRAQPVLPGVISRDALVAAMDSMYPRRGP